MNSQDNAGVAVPTGVYEAGGETVVPAVDINKPSERPLFDMFMGWIQGQGGGFKAYTPEADEPKPWQDERRADSKEARQKNYYPVDPRSYDIGPNGNLIRRLKKPTKAERRAKTLARVAR